MRQKSLSIILVIMMMFTLSACSSANSPEQTAEAFCKSMQTFDIETMMSHVEGADSENADFTALVPGEGMPEAMLTYFKTSAGKMSYTIKETKVDENSATATVEFKYIDSAPVIQAVFGDVISEGMKAALAGTEMSEDAMNTLFETSLEKQQGLIEATFAESTVEIALVKTGDAWKIKEVNDELINVVTSNFLNATSNLSNIGGN